MALAGPTLLTADPDTSNVASYATPSVSPSANALVLVWVWNTDGTNAITPTLSSAFSVVGSTWANEGSVQNSTAVTRITLFSAVTTGSPGSGAITADFGGDAQTGCIVTAVQYTGQDGTDPVINVTTHGHSGAGVTSKTVTLSSGMSSANNHCISGVGHNANEDQTAGGGATELASSDVGYNTPTARMSVQHEVGDNSHSVSWTTSSIGNWIGCEVVEAAAATASLIYPPSATQTYPLRNL